MRFCAETKQIYSTNLSSLVHFNLVVNSYLRKTIRKVLTLAERSEIEFVNVC